MKKLLSILLILASFLTLLVSCDTSNGGEEQATTYRVMVTPSEHCEVTSQNPLDVEEGQDAVFSIAIDDGYAFASTTAGVYDQNAKTLTIPNVTERTVVEFNVDVIDYDPNEEYSYFFNAEKGDTTSVKDGSTVHGGTVITVTANSEDHTFAGWSFGAPSENLSTDLVSTARTFTFVCKPAYVVGTIIEIYANYIDSNVLIYDVNGGTIDDTTYQKRVATNAYYTASKTDEKVVLTYSSEWMEYSEVLPTCWDSGLFRRDGYILKEYNTKADGTGDSYSLGSKVYMNDVEGGTLYCIWAEDSDHSDFSYGTYSMKNPAKYDYILPDWVKDGIILTDYSGDDETVVIPDEIDGKTVIAIDENCFLNVTSMKTLVMGRHIEYVSTNAFVGCSNLNTIYYPDSIYSISDSSFDSATLKNLHHLYVNATRAPVFTVQAEGAFSIKWGRIMASQDQNRIIVIAGSSSYQGLSTPYLEALLDNQYRVVNFGTTRTTNGLLYLEAIQNYTHEGDIVLVAPENSAYMMGETILYWKTVRDLESMYNVFRYVDIANYSSVFSAFSDLNKNYGAKYKESTYENIIALSGKIDKYGDKQGSDRGYYVDDDSYTDSYYVTMNEYFKSINEGTWSDSEYQEQTKDYTDPNNTTWSNITTDHFTIPMNNAIHALQATGAKVYFSFCPVDGDSIVSEARNTTWLKAYDQMILDNFDFDGIVGSCTNYIYAHEYFYDCAFHLNDYGRTYRTYQLYTDLCTTLQIEKAYGLKDVGNFKGVVFEDGTTPKYKVSWLK